MAHLPTTCDLSRLGLDPATVARVELIHREHGDRLYRVGWGGRSFVLKWFGKPEQAIELRSYELLGSLGVPTLPVHGRAENALLLEDLAACPTWRLAEAADAGRAETGVAVAEWYLAFHAAGRELLDGRKGAPAWLRREADALDRATVLETGRRLGLEARPVWRLAADHIEELRAAMRALPETLNYNDFHWSNLALSRQRPPRAIVSDYHLLGIGLAASDCRNVVGSLRGEARASFWESYGPVDESEVVLDAPVATLYALSVAAQRSRRPSWARPLVRQARDGELDRSLRKALEIL
jgi:hypothetical protein